jgi:hypothetical protein
VNNTIKWLLEGDVSVQYMVHRWLLDSDEHMLKQLQSRIALEGFGARILSCQRADGHWGYYYYQPKWTSTHYTLLDLRSLYAPKSLKPCKEMISRMFDQCMKADGSLNLAKSDLPGDICVDGMALNYSAYFCADDPDLGKLADHLLSAQKADGGFTWDIGSEAGDPHTTICVLEGLGQYLNTGLSDRNEDIKAAQRKAVEFLLSRQLFMDDKDIRYRKFSFPYRYRYDLLRVLECFAEQDVPYDPRMKPALDWLQGKRRHDGLWYLENTHKGNVHFVMEELRLPSRFITVKALHILRHYADDIKSK